MDGSIRQKRLGVSSVALSSVSSAGQIVGEGPWRNDIFARTRGQHFIFEGQIPVPSRDRGIGRDQGQREKCIRLAAIVLGTRHHPPICLDSMRARNAKSVIRFHILTEKCLDLANQMRIAT